MPLYDIQKMSYYPFGLQLCDGTTDNNVQSHRYNGKELDKMHGLNTYDYGARQYNPVTARWDRIDPLCEKYYSISPYAYCANNPVKYVDPDGRRVRVTGEYQQEAIRQMSSFVCKGVVLALDKEGNVSATIEEGIKLDKNTKKLLAVINDENIKVNLKTVGDETREEITGGAFAGNEVKTDEQGQVQVEAFQSVNPKQLAVVDTYITKKGTAIVHEVTEAYEGAKLAMKKGEGSREKGKKNPFYKKAHKNAISQPYLYSSFITENTRELNIKHLMSGFMLHLIVLHHITHLLT